MCRFSNQLVTPLLWRSPHIHATPRAQSFLLALNRSWDRLAPLVKSLSLVYYEGDSDEEDDESGFSNSQDDEGGSDDSSAVCVPADDPEWSIQRILLPDEYQAGSWERDDLVWHALQLALYKLPNLTSLGINLETREQFQHVQHIANREIRFTSNTWPYSAGLNLARCVALSGLDPHELEPQHLPTSHLHFYGCRRVWINWMPWFYMTLFPEPDETSDPPHLCLSMYSIDVTQTDVFDLLAQLERRRRKAGRRPFQTITLRVRKHWAKWVLDRLAESRWKARHKVQVRLWETGSAKSVSKAQVADFVSGDWESWVDELASDGLHEGIGRLLTSESIQRLELDVESDDSSHSDGESVASTITYPSSHVESDFEQEPITL
jgi:hypothetical protein